jgi:hypothetical protein
MKGWLSLAALAAAVAALALWLYYNPASKDGETQALSALKVPDVKRVRVERGADVAIALERRDGTWRITTPFSARADAFQVARLLTVLDARSAVQYPATDLARYGLDKPVAKLTIEDQAFTFGQYNTTTREQYVLVDGKVYVIPLGPGAALPRDAQALLARELLAADEVPVRIELPELAADLHDGKWELTPPNDSSADERVAWVEAWKHASALKVERYEGALPGPFVRITVKGGPTITLGIVQRDPEVVLVRADESIAYHFVSGVAKRLLSPPGKNP